MNPDSSSRLPCFANTDLVAPKGRLTHTPNRREIYLPSDHAFIDLQLTTCVSFSWLRHEPPRLFCHCLFSLSPIPKHVCFWHAFLTRPQGQTRSAVLSWASSPQRACSQLPGKCSLFLYAHGFRDQGSAKPNRLLCIYVLSEGMACPEQ